MTFASPVICTLHDSDLTSLFNKKTTPLVRAVCLVTMATVKCKDAAEDRLASATSKQRNTLNHFQRFLDDCPPQIGEDIMEVEDIPHKGIGLPRRASSKDTNEFWSKMMGCFVSCLSLATHCRDPNKKLEFSSVDGYFTSLKECFTTKFRHESPIPVFSDPEWGELRAKLKGSFRGRVDDHTRRR